MTSPAPWVAQHAQHEEFAELLKRMEQHQQALVSQVQPGMSFGSLHHRMHEQLTDLLINAGVIECDADAALELGLSETFCPHGLGHLLGLQVHDVGGHLADRNGTPRPPPANYPALRFTRDLEVGQVFTVEPGLYFIPSLLAKLRTTNAPVNWTIVERLSGYGGIRIEDNVCVTADGVENLTRDAFASVANE